MTRHTHHCHACGQGFYSYGTEARHRHNFPAMCKRGKRFAEFEAEVARQRAAEAAG